MTPTERVNVGLIITTIVFALATGIAIGKCV